MKSNLKSFLPSLLFLIAAAAFATVGWTKSQPAREAALETAREAIHAEGCCAVPQPVHACCDTNAPAVPAP